MSEAKRDRTWVLICDRSVPNSNIAYRQFAQLAKNIWGSGGDAGGEAAYSKRGKFIGKSSSLLTICGAVGD